MDNGGSREGEGGMFSSAELEELPAEAPSSSEGEVVVAVVALVVVVAALMEVVVTAAGEPRRGWSKEWKKRSTSRLCSNRPV